MLSSKGLKLHFLDLISTSIWLVQNILGSLGWTCQRYIPKLAEFTHWWIKKRAFQSFFLDFLWTALLEPFFTISNTSLKPIFDTPLIKVLATKNCKLVGSITTQPTIIQPLNFPEFHTKKICKTDSKPTQAGFLAQQNTSHNSGHQTYGPQ